MALSDTLIPFSLFGSHYEGRDGKPYAVSTVIVATDGSGNFEDIQSAINDLPSKGGVVYIKEGTYKITTPINITKSNVMIRGAGMATVIYGDGCNAINIGDNVSTYKKINVESCYIHTTSAAAEIAINIRKCEDCCILNCYIGGGVKGISGNITNKRTIIASCHLDTSGMTLQGEYNTVTGNIINSPLYDAIKVENASYLTITGNVIHDGTAHGINIITCSYICVTGNMVEDLQDIGIRLESNDFSTVTGNIIKNSTNSGIYLTDEDFAIISSNNTTGNGDHGIDIHDAVSDKNLVVGNLCLNNTNANYNDSGTNTTAGNNITA